MKIIQFVPRLPPYTDGVADYAIKLGEQLQIDHNVVTQFLVFQTGLKLASETHGFPVKSLQAHSAEALLAAIPADVEAILLHYSNYPYLKHKLDAPYWLPQALQRAIQARQLRLIVMFHELPMLKLGNFKALNPLQGWVSRRLAQIAHTVVTDSAKFQTRLSRWTKRTIPCIPDFSTIGEPDQGEVLPLEQRARRLVIFGGSDRNRVYQHHLDVLLQTCQALQLEEVCDIGKPLRLDPTLFGEVRLVEMGFQPAEVVRQTMLNALAGMIDYARFPGDLGKSSVFAAFCAHGLLPICTAYNPSEADGVHLDHNYVVAGQHLKDLTPSQLQAVASQARNWYGTHSLAANTEVFAALLKGAERYPAQDEQTELRPISLST